MSWEDETRIVCLIDFGLESHGLRDLVTGTTAPALLRCYALRIFQNLCILIRNGGFKVIIVTGRLFYVSSNKKAREDIF